MIKTAIISLCYNKLEEATKPFLNSLYNFTDEKTFDLFIVDNGSTDGSAKYIENFALNHPNIKLIKNKENLGYSKGNNIGLKEALKGDYEYFGLLNNDILFTPNWLNNTLKLFETGDNFGMVSPRIQKKGGLTPKNYLEKYEKYLSKFKGSYKEVLEPLFCCVLIKREVINKTGLLDEGFSPAFFEDNDYCFRVMYQGYRLAYSNSAFVYHNHSTTSKTIPAEIFNRNKEYFFKKHPLGKWVYEHKRTNILKSIKNYIKESFE